MDASRPAIGISGIIVPNGPMGGRFRDVENLMGHFGQFGPGTRPRDHSQWNRLVLQLGFPELSSQGDMENLMGHFGPLGPELGPGSISKGFSGNTITPGSFLAGVCWKCAAFWVHCVRHYVR